MPLFRTAGSTNRNWPRLLALLAGLAVAGASFVLLRAWAGSDSSAVRLPVPAREITAYEVIRPEDLVWGAFPAAAGLEGAVASPAEAVGKVAAAPLARGLPIGRKVLLDRGAAGAVRVVAVNVDFARTAGARPGDVVDVYWLRPEQANWTPGSASVLLARDALVLGVYDKNGRPAAVSSQTGGATVVTLAVKPQEVQAVVAGAAPEAKNIALVRKFASGGEVDGLAAVQGEQGAAGSAAGAEASEEDGAG